MIEDLDPVKRGLTTIKALTQKCRAHAEIDAAIGEDRSPRWSDFSKLPYINMIIKESHRWRPVSPLGVSHALAEGKQLFSFNNKR